MDRVKLLNYFRDEIGFEISFVKEAYLKKAFCVNYYELKTQEGNEVNKQLSSCESKGNLPLALVGEKVFQLFKVSDLYRLNMPISMYISVSKRGDDAYACKICERLGLFDFAYVQVEDEIKTTFEGNDGTTKKAQLLFALIGAIYLTIDENGQSFSELKKFMRKIENN